MPRVPDQQGREHQQDEGAAEAAGVGNHGLDIAVGQNDHEDGEAEKNRPEAFYAICMIIYQARAGLLPPYILLDGQDV